MKRKFRNVMLLLACLCMAAPEAMADRHLGARSTPSRTERHSSQAPRGSSGRPGLGGQGNGSHRPGGNNGNNGNHGAGQRPPHQGGGGQNNRPGNPGHNNGNHNNYRPGGHNPGRPGVGGSPNHGYRPSGPHGRPVVMNPPHRPYRPPMTRPYRPVPSRSWRPVAGVPVIRGILGLVFGAAFGVSLDYLYANGYNVDGYGNNIVYLRNVPALNLIWTDGALYYGANGLDASTFYYTTPARDLARYNQCYNSLVATYGVPVVVNNVGATLSSTWYGGGNGYITLSFGTQSTGRFLTSLTFGR